MTAAATTGRPTGPGQTWASDAPELMTAAEVSVALRVSRMTIYRLIERSELPSVRVGRSFRIPRPGVESLLHGPTVLGLDPGAPTD